ncbi:hypothetical protein AAG906_006884 [Vitis piasezkii]
MGKMLFLERWSLGVGCLKNGAHLSEIRVRIVCLLVHSWEMKLFVNLGNALVALVLVKARGRNLLGITRHRESKVEEDFTSVSCAEGAWAERSLCPKKWGGSIKSVLHVEERAFDLSDSARNSGPSLVVITLRSQGLNSVVKSSKTKTETHLGCSLNRFTYFSTFLGMPVKGLRGRFWLAQGKRRIGKGRRLPSLGKGAKGAPSLCVGGLTYQCQELTISF